MKAERNLEQKELINYWNKQQRNTIHKNHMTDLQLQL